MTGPGASPRRHLEVGIWTAVVLVFLGSLEFPPGYSLSAFYVVPVLFAIRARRPRIAYLVAAVATVLMVLAAVLVQPPAAASAVLLSRTATALTLWVTAYVVVSRRNAEAQLGGEVRGRREVEAALRRSGKDLEDLKYALDQSAIVAMTNVQGDITYANDKFCEISKYSRGELMGHNHRLLNSGLHPVEFFQSMYRTIANGRVWRGEIRNRAKDGALYWVDTTIVPFLDSHGRPYQYTAIRYDITERKRSEAVLRAQTALVQVGKMAAVVAHEVRNPLAGIRGAVQMIARRLGAGSPEHNIAHEIVTRIDTLNDIVQDLLLFARPREPVLLPVPVSNLMRETATLFRADPGVKDIDLEIRDDAATVVADPEQLKLVLVNLLMNAAQAMQGRGAIALASARVAGGHELRIIDQGPGIATDIREHLFEPFFTTKHRGTGLGLATARRIIEAHGGTIALECPPEGGTVAVVRLPDQAATVEAAITPGVSS